MQPTPRYRPEAAPEGETDAPTEDTSDAWKASCLCGTEGEVRPRGRRPQPPDTPASAVEPPPSRAARGSNVAAPPTPARRLSLWQLLDRVTRKQHRKRVLGKVSLVVGGSSTRREGAKRAGQREA